jgi:hypothetical protein
MQGESGERGAGSGKLIRLLCASAIARSYGGQVGATRRGAQKV